MWGICSSSSSSNISWLETNWGLDGFERAVVVSWFQLAGIFCSVKPWGPSFLLCSCTPALLCWFPCIPVVLVTGIIDGKTFFKFYFWWSTLIWMNGSYMSPAGWGDYKAGEWTLRIWDLGKVDYKWIRAFWKIPVGADPDLLNRIFSLWELWGSPTECLVSGRFRHWFEL